MVDIERLFRAAFCMARQCWEQAILAQAMLESGNTGKAFEYVVGNMVVRQHEDGRLCDVENTPAAADSAFCIPTVLWLGKKSKNAAYLEAAERNYTYFEEKAARAENGAIYHMIGTCEIWADGMGYLPYAYAVMGNPKGAVEQMYLVLEKLYNPENGLYMQRIDDSTGKVLNGEWSIGEGWILTGLVRLYCELQNQCPQKYGEEKERIKKTFQELLDTVLTYETEDHFFFDMMTDKSTYKETESGIMVAYAIYRAIQSGMIEKEYQTRADALRKAAESKIDEDGFVQDCAGSPSFTNPGTSVEGQMHMVMMEQAYRELLGQKGV